MSNTTKEKILLIAPELSGITDQDVWDLFLDDVARTITSARYGTDQERAQRYLCAHLLTLSNSLDSSRNVRATGQVTSLKTGEESINFASSSNSNKKFDPYDSTVYGLEFKKIRSQNVLGFNSYTPGDL